MKKWILVVSCLLLVLFVGCEDIQRLFGLLPAGRAKLTSSGDAVGGSSTSMSINSFTTSTPQPPLGLTITIEKVEISQNGYDWTTILGTPIELNTENWWTPSGNGWAVSGGDTLNTGMELADGEYSAVRVYFGPNITAKCYDVNLTTVTEKTRTDFNTKVNPITIYHPECQYITDNGYDIDTFINTYPFLHAKLKIEKGKESEMKILIDCWGIPLKALDTDQVWATFRDGLDKLIHGDELLDDPGPLEVGIYNDIN